MAPFNMTDEEFAKYAAHTVAAIGIGDLPIVKEIICRFETLVDENINFEQEIERLEAENIKLEREIRGLEDENIELEYENGALEDE